MAKSHIDTEQSMNSSSKSHHETESARYNRLLAKYEALKGANNDALVMLLAGHSTQALKDIQRGNRIAAAI